MRFNLLLSQLACAVLMAACAVAPPPPPPKPPAIASLMGEAERAIKDGKNEQAIVLLKSAASFYPADKAPLLRIAQVQFECHNYGEAIFHAQEVLERDPDDLVAHSIVAVSGLRVSSKALSDLALKNNLSGSVRAEAQDLAKLLRASIGGDIIVPTKVSVRPKPAAKAPVTHAAPKIASDPFEGLN